MKSVQGTVVLGYAGHAGSLDALAGHVRAGRGVVAVIVDVGQERDLDEVREQALAHGALRAHVFDAREEFARDQVLPALRVAPLDALDGTALAAPLVARTLAEVAAIENAATAHGADAFDAVLDPGRTRGRTLLERPVLDLAHAPDRPAHVELRIEGGVPVAINGVSLTVAELLESLAVIAGQHGIGRLPRIDAPAAPLVHAAYASLSGADGTVHFELLRGVLTIASVSRRSLVNLA